jgi:hypothetical protein
MLLLQPHILIHGSCNANSKKKEREKKGKKRKERQNEEREIQQLTQQESRACMHAAGIAL